jgi:hypothetical protein
MNAARRARRIRALAIALLLLVIAPGAHAEPSEADKGRARALMDEGAALVEQHSFAAALDKFQKADEIMRVPSTGLEVAKALGALGRLIEARRVALRVAGSAKEPNEPDAFTRAREAAVALAAELDARIPRLRVELRDVPQGAEATLSIDGREVPAKEASGEQILSPGPHEILAEAGSVRASMRVTLSERDRRTTTLTLPSAKTASSVPEPPTRKTERSNTAGYVVGGVGLVGLAIAGVTSVVIVGNDKTIKDHCPSDTCPTQEDLDRVDRQKSLEVINAIAWGVGLAGTSIGAYLILSNPGGKDETAISPGWSLAGPTISVRRRF